MEVISYSNVKVEGFPFHKIISMEIKHNPNEHGIAQVTGEIDNEQAQRIVQRVDEKMIVMITASAKGQPSKLFCGCVDKISADRENEYSRVNLQLVSTSKRLDITKEDKTFQDTSKTYGQIVSEDISETGDLHMMVSDKAIGALIMKYSQTKWEFALRMAGKLGAPLVTDIYSERPQLYIGMPPARKTIQIESQTFGSDGGSEIIETDAYAYLGDQISLNGKKNKTIKGVHAYLADGIMHMEYQLMDAGTGTLSNMSALGVKAGINGTLNAEQAGGLNAASGAGDVSAIAAPPAGSQASGKMMKGIVQAVSGDKVQVHLVDIDSSYDVGGNWWFPYSTAYSSSDGSGWYCMPEVGDEVRVFFPSGNEGDAFAASSVCSNPPSNPKHKSWKTPGGKEILLTDEGLYIIGKSGKIYINLTDEKGVEIYSDKEINVSSDAKVSISAADELHIVAENQITIGTEEAYIDLTKNTATLAASEILIN